MALFGKNFPGGNRGLSLTARAAIALSIASLMGLGAVWLAGKLSPGSSLVAWALAGTCLFLVLPLARWVTSPLRTGLAVLDQALLSYKDGDFSLRLVPPKQPELRRLNEFFNHLAALASEERNAVYQRELLLDTLVQSTPLAMVLLGPDGRVELINQEARDLFAVRGQVRNLDLQDLLAEAPEPFREVLDNERDTLFTLTTNDEPETFHLARRRFRINTLAYQIILIKRLTRELKRQEISSWKKLIRLLNHEMNNTLAPIRSLLHSARRLSQTPAQHHKLDKVFDTLDHTTLHLQRFLEEYATFARLPSPRREKIQWQAFLENLALLTRFTLEDSLVSKEAFFDPAQIQQALLNLIKNAHEASGKNGEVKDGTVTLALANTDQGGTIIRVLDRGKGMQPEAMEKALLPFFSTKKTGTGLGLPLCREILESHGGTLRLSQRPGGGTTVTCWLPEDL